MSQASFKNHCTQSSFWGRLFAIDHPKTHWYLAALVAICLIASLVLLPSKPVEAKKKTVAINIEVEPSSAVEASIDNPEPIIEEKPAPPSLVWHQQVIRSGDNITTLFKRESLGAGEVHRFISSSPEAKSLTKLKPGEAIEFGFDDSNLLKQITYNQSALTSLRFTAIDGSYWAEKITRTPETIKTFRRATINSSLYMDADKAALPHSIIMELANIFGWDIDFALDIRKGDSFALLYEELYLDGELIDTGSILAASFTNRGKTFKAVRFTDESGRGDYYSPDGRVMRKAFLRAPLDFSRVSSNFNPNRLHPVFKTKRPHRGVDYAASRGTPVYAAGDGKVIASGYSKANGNYVFIQHGQKYTTKYLHLNKRRIKKGQRVSQRTVIGTVGSTGYATGPHLHYEFLVNGVHRNPRTVKLPEAEPISKSLHTAFFASTTPVLAQLDRLASDKVLASTTNSPSNDG